MNEIKLNDAETCKQFRKNFVIGFVSREDEPINRCETVINFGTMIKFY